MFNSLSQGNATESSRRLQAYLACGLAVALAIVVSIASTTGIGVGDSWFDEQRIISLIALGLASLLCAAWLRVDRERSNVLLAAVLVLGLVSAAAAARPFVAAVDWSVYCLIAVLVMAARSDSRPTLTLTVALVGLIVPTAYTAGVTANYVSSLLLGFPIGAETLLVGFSNPRFPAHLQVLTIPLLPLALGLAPAGLWKWCVATTAALWWMCFIGSGSRTGWIALAAVSVSLLSFGTAGRQWVRTQIAFSAAGFALWLLLFIGVPNVMGATTAIETGRFSNFASVGARRVLLSISADAVIAHPLLGIGPMHFAYVDNGQGAHPHNFWLQLAAEWGVPVALLAGGVAAGFFYQLVRAVRQKQDSRTQSTGLALTAAVAAWGVGVLADGYMVVPTSQIMSAVVLMLAAIWLRQSKSAGAASGRGRSLTYVGVGLCGIALIVLAALPFTGFGQPAPREQAWRSEHRGESLWPRFWQQGWIGPNDDPTVRRDPLRSWSEK